MAPLVLAVRRPLICRATSLAVNSLAALKHYKDYRWRRHRYSSGIRHISEGITDNRTDISEGILVDRTAVNYQVAQESREISWSSAASSRIPGVVKEFSRSFKEFSRSFKEFSRSFKEFSRSCKEFTPSSPQGASHPCHG